jgi:hypothetical protein
MLCWADVGDWFESFPAAGAGGLPFLHGWYHSSGRESYDGSGVRILCDGLLFRQSLVALLCPAGVPCFP